MGRTKEQYIVFRHEGKELAAYTTRGTFKGEAEATARLLAAEKGIRTEDIRITIEERSRRA